MADRLSALAGGYDVLFCDIWGVLHGGRRAYPHAIDALRRFRERGGRVAMVSNSPRPGKPLAGQLRDIYATPPDCFDTVVSAGDVMVEALRARPGHWHLEGPESDLAIFDGLPVTFGPLAGARGVVMTQLRDGSTETAEDYRALLTVMRAKGQLFVCGNADRIVDHGGRRYVCPGAVADLHEAMGGEVVWCGKPYRPIYDLAFAALGHPAPARVLAIGDGLATDVAGAEAMGLDVFFVSGGIHAAEIDDHAGLQSRYPRLVGVAERFAW
jgi:HAD superfamily hydrolase (TIGR01459 family)